MEQAMSDTSWAQRGPSIRNRGREEIMSYDFVSELATKIANAAHQSFSFSHIDTLTDFYGTVQGILSDALSNRPTPVAGEWRIVPVADDSAMQEAGRDAVYTELGKQSGGLPIARAVWQAMLAAAPKKQED